LLAKRADCLFKMGDFKQALADASSVIAEKDDSLRAWLTRLYCLRELKRYEEAVADTTSLLERWFVDFLRQSFVTETQINIHHGVKQGPKRTDYPQFGRKSPVRFKKKPATRSLRHSQRWTSGKRNRNQARIQGSGTGVPSGQMSSR